MRYKSQNNKNENNDDVKSLTNQTFSQFDCFIFQIKTWCAFFFYVKPPTTVSVSALLILLCRFHLSTLVQNALDAILLLVFYFKLKRNVCLTGFEYNLLDLIFSTKNRLHSYLFDVFWMMSNLKVLNFFSSKCMEKYNFFELTSKNEFK